MARLIQPKLRVRDDLYRRIERTAKKRGVSVNYEMTSRLERSFDHDAARTLEMVGADIKLSWAKFGERFLLLELEDQVRERLTKLTATIDELAAMSASESAIEREAAMSAIKDANVKLRNTLRAIERSAEVMKNIGDDMKGVS